MERELEQVGINVIRGLAMDAPQKANSGHSGTAMALAPLAHVLWTRIMKYDPSDPDWPDRDRFVLSCGHASILLYSMLYLTGYDIELEDLRQFRQWGSKTPGHPEVHHLKGVDTTTGPLGQGIGNAVGMAMAERSLRARFGSELFDHRIFVTVSDGDLEEGLSHEAASLAGHQGLGRLICVYDDNHITIDGPTELSYSDDAAKRFEAYGWHVERAGEIANDTDALEAAVRRAMAVDDRPSMIVLRSHIGYPSPKYTDTDFAHGNPLGEDEIRVTKEILGLPPDETFYVPDDVLEMYRGFGREGKTVRVGWEKRKAAYSGNTDELDASLAGRGLAGWSTKLPVWEAGASLATRVAMGECLNAVVDTIPGLLVGGGDVSGNTGTLLKGANALSPEHPDGQQMYWGVREHGLASAMVGMAHHGGLLPVGGIFFIFSDYMRPAVRLAAMSEAHVIFAWSHDSVGVGEDGPTHQPVEQLGVMRATPGLRVLRPADANETAHALRIAVDEKGATGILLTRQKVPVLEGTADAFEGVSKGAYVLHDTGKTPQIVLLGTGSEVHVCVAAAEQLASAGVVTRVVSMPSWELFDAAGEKYQRQVLPAGVPVLSVEAASSFGWARWAQAHVAVDRFGASAPGNRVLEELGFTPDNVARRAQELLGGNP